MEPRILVLIMLACLPLLCSAMWQQVAAPVATAGGQFYQTGYVPLIFELSQPVPPGSFPVPGMMRIGNNFVPQFPFIQAAQSIGSVLVGAATIFGGRNSNKRGSRRGRRQSNKKTALDEDQPELDHNDADDAGCDELSQTSAAAARASSPPVLSEEDAEHLTEQLEKGPGTEAHQSAVDAIRGRVASLTLDEHGCRVVQSALQYCRNETAAVLASELQGNVQDAIHSKFGNFVVQAVVEKLPYYMAPFVVDEMRGHAAEFARHNFGCRILCRLLEHPSKEVMKDLTQELLNDAYDLSRHAFGYHVIKHILEHGAEDQRKAVVDALLAKEPLRRQSKHKRTSFVIERALTYCADGGEAFKALERELLQGIDSFGIMDLAKHQFARHVLEQLVRRSPLARQRLLDNIEEVRKDKIGKRLLRSIFGESMGVEAKETPVAQSRTSFSEMQDTTVSEKRQVEEIAWSDDMTEASTQDSADIEATVREPDEQESHVNEEDGEDVRCIAGQVQSGQQSCWPRHGRLQDLIMKAPWRQKQHGQQRPSCRS